MKKKKLRKRLIDAVVLIAVFLVAVVVFSYLTNKDNNNMTADMNAATFPQISFYYDDYNLNLLSGYANEMDLTAMRDTITPISNNHLSVAIHSYESAIQSLKYHVYTIDGQEELLSDEIDQPSEECALDFEDEELFSEERLLVLDLTLTTGKTIYYYTRVRDASDTYIIDNLDYIDTFYNAAVNKTVEAGIGDDLETDESVDLYSYQHVDISSSYEYVTWGDLKPQILGTVVWKIKELNETYTSVQLEYQVQCRGEDSKDEKDVYNVEEFFRVRTQDQDDKETYLLDYERDAEQVFDPSGQVITENGILLGVTDSDVEYVVNNKGTIVSFVEAGELWNYNLDADKLSEVFSFSDSESNDVRNQVQEHKIQILDMDSAGNTTFAVYGYMNRGEHEGEVGAAIYYFDISKNSVEEIVFIESDEAPDRAMTALSEMIYYSVANNDVYAMIDGTLYRYNVDFEDTTTLIEGMDEDRYATSADGKWIAYQNGDNAEECNSIVVLNLSTEKERKITCHSGESIWPLGFINDDVIYGIAKQDDVGTSVSGERTVAMYDLVIESSDGTVLKDYQEDGIYVSGVEVTDTMMTLNRVIKKGKGYSATASDYITSNEEEKTSNITLETYYGDRKLTEMRLTFADGISDKNPKLLKPKQVLFENPTTVAFESSDDSDWYYIYGQGELQGDTTSVAEAIQMADDCYGVVVDANQNYIWEKGNRDLVYNIIDQDDLIEKICSKLKKGTSAIDTVSSLNDGKVLDLTGCTTEQILYIIDQDNPVIAVTGDDEMVVITGYGSDSVTYEEADSGEESTVSYEDMDNMTKESGYVYIAF